MLNNVKTLSFSVFINGFRGVRKVRVRTVPESPYIHYYLLKENCLQDIIKLENDKHVLEKIFEDIFLNMDCIKIIKIEDFICVANQSIYNVSKNLATNESNVPEVFGEHEYFLKFDDFDFYFIIHLDWISVSNDELSSSLNIDF
jgi:hypothetical protein